jgi:hypothetical protein
VDTWLTSLSHQYSRAITEFERALLHCPEELWEASLWPVRKDHAHVWPVRRAGSKVNGDESMLQIHSAFWNVAYHALFHHDLDLSRGVSSFKPTAPFREDEHGANVVPRRTYAKDELLKYVALGREKAGDVIGNLSLKDDEALLPAKSRRPGVPFLDLLLGNLRHMQEHSAQLNLFLGQHEAFKLTDFERHTGVTPEQGANLLSIRVRGKPDDEVDAFAEGAGGYEQLLPVIAMGFCARVHPKHDVIVGFDIGPRFAIRVARGKAEVQMTMPKRVDATVHMSERDFLRLMSEDLEVGEAINDGRLKIEWERRISRWLNCHAFVIDLHRLRAVPNSSGLTGRQTRTPTGHTRCVRRLARSAKEREGRCRSIFRGSATRLRRGPG